MSKMDCRLPIVLLYSLFNIMNFYVKKKSLNWKISQLKRSLGKLFLVTDLMTFLSIVSITFFRLCLSYICSRYEDGDGRGRGGGFKEIPLKTKFSLIFTFQTDCALYFPSKYVNSWPTSGVCLLWRGLPYASGWSQELQMRVLHSATTWSEVTDEFMIYKCEDFHL